MVITEMTNTLMTGRALVETEPVRYQLEEIQLSLDKEGLEKVEHHHIQRQLGGTVRKEYGCCCWQMNSPSSSGASWLSAVGTWWKVRGQRLERGGWHCQVRPQQLLWSLLSWFVNDNHDWSSWFCEVDIPSGSFVRWKQSDDGFQLKFAFIVLRYNWTSLLNWGQVKTLYT